MLRNFVMLITVAIAGMAQTPLPQTLRSPVLAAELINLLTQHGLDSVAERGGHSPKAELFLPFEGDQTLSLILSKAFLLVNDKDITDPSITRQIGGK